MQSKIGSFKRLVWISGCAIMLTGCGDTYNSLGNSNKVGAADYQPAVDLVASYMTAEDYTQDLAFCRQIAMQKQATASQLAQEAAAADAFEGAVSGALTGMLTEEGDVFNSRSDTQRAAEGAIAGAILGSIGGTAQRARAVSKAGRETIDKCLENRGYVIY